MGFWRCHGLNMRTNPGRSCGLGTPLCLFGTLVTVTSFWTSLARAAGLGEEAPPKQPAPSKDAGLSGYLTVALGGSNVGLTARGLFTLAKGSWFAAANAGYSDEFKPITGPYPILEQKDVGVVAGWHHRGGYHFVALGLGLGYVQSVNRGSFLKMEDGMSGTHQVYEKIDRAGIGVPLLAHGGLYLGPIGLGAMLFGNVNSTLPSIGAAITVSVGSF